MLIDGFNAACKNIAVSSLKVGDESTSAIRFWTTGKGNLSHLSNIFRKLETMDTEFNTVACSVTGSLLFIEVHRGKEGKKQINYHQDLEATVACTKIMTEATKGIGHKYKKGATKDCFYFW